MPGPTALFTIAGLIGIAVSLAGNEAAGTVADFAPAFDLAREAGLGLTAHAGEVIGPESVRAALDGWGVTRIGHGVRSVEYMDLVHRLAAEVPVISRGIHLGPAGLTTRRRAAYCGTPLLPSALSHNRAVEAGSVVGRMAPEIVSVSTLPAVRSYFTQLPLVGKLTFQVWGEWSKLQATTTSAAPAVAVVPRQ